MKTDKPRIFVLSRDDDSEFRWASDGWHSYTSGTRYSAKGKRLMDLAHRAIVTHDTVPAVIEALKAAGFDVQRTA